jgi:hypothetical protein
LTRKDLISGSYMSWRLGSSIRLIKISNNFAALENLIDDEDK